MRVSEELSWPPVTGFLVSAPVTDNKVVILRPRRSTMTQHKKPLPFWFVQRPPSGDHPFFLAQNTDHTVLR